MSDTADAKDAIGMCLWSMRQRIVDKELGVLLMMTTRIVENCLGETFVELQELWVQLLLSLAHAWERQICSGDDAQAHSWVMPWALSILQCADYIGGDADRTD